MLFHSSQAEREKGAVRSGERADRADRKIRRSMQNESSKGINVEAGPASCMTLVAVREA